MQISAADQAFFAGKRFEKLASLFNRADVARCLGSLKNYNSITKFGWKKLLDRLLETVWSSNLEQDTLVC